MLKYNPRFKPYARRLRKDMTDAEQKLWKQLRGKQIGGTQFYRQKPLGNVIVDFYSPNAGLVVEVDGSQHLEAEHRSKGAVLETIHREVMERVGGRNPP
jgi:very-short-patch-repair endonuclease